MNTSIYFPAIGASIVHGFRKDIKHINGKSFRFFNNSNGLFNYGKALITAGHFYKNKIKEEIDFNLEKDIILGDSGGFQLSTGAVKYSDEIVKLFFDWLEENTNYAMNLDFPPYIKKFTGQVEDYNENDYFTEKLAISKKHFEYFNKNQKGTTKFLNVLHGRNLKELDRWYNEIKDFNFNGGWSIGSLSTRSTSDIYLVLLTFFYLLQKGELDKQYNDKLALLHFLGFSKVASLPVVLYLQKILNDRKSNITISFDSSSPFLKAAYGRYSLYFTSTGIKDFRFLHSTLKNKDKMNLDQPLPCSCPVCKNITFKDIYNFSNPEKESFSTEMYMYLGEHNLYSFLKYKHNIETIINLNSPEINEEFFSSDIKQIFNIVDQALKSKDPLKYIFEQKAMIINLDTEKEFQQHTLTNFIS